MPKIKKQRGGKRHRGSRVVTAAAEKETDYAEICTDPAIVTLSPEAQLQAKCQVCVHVITSELREACPALLSKLFGPAWETTSLSVLTTHPKPKAFLELDFSQLMQLVDKQWDAVFACAFAADARKLAVRCRGFRNELAHQASTLTSAHLQHSLAMLVQLAEECRLPSARALRIEIAAWSPYESDKRRPLAVSQSVESAGASSPSAVLVGPTAESLSAALETAGDEFSRMGSYTEATDAYRRAMASHQRTCRLLCKEAKAYMSLGEDDLAQEDCEDALCLDPSDTSAIATLCELLMRKKRWEEVERILETAVKAHPRSTDLAIMLRECKANIARAATVYHYDGEGAMELLSGHCRSIHDPCVPLAQSIQLETKEGLRLAKQFEQTTPIMYRAHQLRDSNNTVAALKEYERAAAMGSACALYNAALLQLPSSNTVVCDAGAAFKKLLEAAAQPPGVIAGDKWIENLGVSLAQNSLGCMYRDADGVDQDLSRSRNWFVKGASNGNVFAQNSLGVAFLRGAGGERDYEQARAWFERAAATNHPPAQTNLARMLLDGQGGPKDEKRALVLLKVAAARGMHDAVNLLSLMEVKGFQTTLKQAAAKGDLNAAAKLAQMLWDGHDGVDQDRTEAERLLVNGCSKGHLPSMLTLVHLLQSQLPERADDYRTYVELGARHGSPDCQHQLGLLLTESNDLKQAEVWFQKAAIQGDRQAAKQIEEWPEVLEMENTLLQFERSRGLLPLFRRSDRIVRMVDARDPGAKGSFAKVHAVLQKFQFAALTPLHPTTLQPDRPMEYGEGLRICEQQARAGAPGATRYMQAVNHQIQACMLSAEGNHVEAVRQLWLSYEAADSIPCMVDMAAAFDVSVQAVLRSEPDHPEALFCNCKSTTNKLSVKIMVLELQRIVALHPGRPEFQELLGCMLGFDKQWQAALMRFSKCIELDPARFGALYLRGVAHHNLPDEPKEETHARAAADFQAYLRLAPPDDRKVPEAWYYLCFTTMIQDKGKGSQQAKAYLMKAVDAESVRLPVHERVLLPFVPMLQIAFDDKPAPRSCTVCALVSELSVCNQCKTTRYCSRACQQLHWKTHKHDCLRIADATGPTTTR